MIKSNESPMQILWRRRNVWPPFVWMPLLWNSKSGNENWVYSSTGTHTKRIQTLLEFATIELIDKTLRQVDDQSEDKNFDDPN